MAQNIRKALETPYHKIEDEVKEAMEEITLQSMIEEFRELMSDQNESTPVSLEQ